MRVGVPKEIKKNEHRIGLTPTAVREYVAHGHDVTVEAGAGQVECTINGIGERAGNCSLEEVVMALRTRCDHYGCETGIVTQQTC